MELRCLHEIRKKNKSSNSSENICGIYSEMGKINGQSTNNQDLIVLFYDTKTLYRDESKNSYTNYSGVIYGSFHIFSERWLKTKAVFKIIFDLECICVRSNRVHITVSKPK